MVGERIQRIPYPNMKINGIQIPVSVNEVLLECSSVVYHLGCLPAVGTEVSGWDRDLMVDRA